MRFTRNAGEPREPTEYFRMHEQELIKKLDRRTAEAEADEAGS